MNYRVLILPEAEREADEAYLWMAESAPERAAAWLQGLRAAIATLQTHPRRCPLAPENAFFSEEIRQLLYGRRRHAYRVLFEVRDDEQTVTILHVVHGARDYLRPREGVGGEDERET
jgi:plasmid stabilization system protein ParE